MAQRSGQREGGPQVDWEGLEGSPEFRELVATRKRLINPLLLVTAVALAIYTALLIIGGDSFLTDAIVGRFTWGLLLIVVMTFLIFILAAIYSRVSLEKLDPLVERTKAMALRRADGPSHDDTASRPSDV
jgi:uncharacterized membrane protein (DUF485 family)